MKGLWNMAERNNRSGNDRRQKFVTKPENRRTDDDRRFLLNDPDRTIGRLRLIHIFDRLSSDQLKKLLLFSSKKQFKKNEVIYSIGDESNEMFFLINGKIRVLYENGGESSNIAPNGIIGEMGLFTGEKRTVSIIAAMKITLISFNRIEFPAFLANR